MFADRDDMAGVVGLALVIATTFAMLVIIFL
jgi:hypothetical protein